MFSSFFTGPRKPELTLIPHDEVDRALHRLCTPPVHDKKGSKGSIDDETFHRISDLLKHLEPHIKASGWSSRPRTYTVLRNIGREDLMPEFVTLGLKDYSFPYSVEKIPEVLTGDSLREKFMKAQNYVLTEASQLENGPEGRHAHTKKGEDLFHFHKHLGSGGYGSVDWVWSRLSSNEYARKQFMRKKNPREDQNLLRNFDQEISSLKRLSHQHLVSYVGSYTDQRTVAYLMEPVADCNLETYLCQSRTFIEARLPSLRSYFGCLSSAVSYLHRQRIRHRDLKPQNILVKGHGIFITDFGTALDWSKTGKDTTMEINAPFTEQYMAPEVAKRVPRNSASDMWSLGIVFLDITTVLRGRTLKDMKRFFQEHGTRHRCVWANAEAAHAWFEQLRQADSGPESDNEPLMWIKDLTQSVPSNRPMAWALINQIRNASSIGSFIGHCCITDDEAEYYPSPPSSSQGEDVEEFYPTAEFSEPQERPFGSLIEPSRQTSIERWLESDPDLRLEALPEFADVSGENFRGTPYEILEDTTTQYTVRTNSPEASVLGNPATVEQCEGYDIVEDTSDDEKTIDRRGQGYETREDSSESEVTVKDLSSITKRKSELIKNDQTNVVDNGHGTGVLSSKASEALRVHLDALPEDSFEDHPLTTPSQACLPVPDLDPHTVAINTVPSSAESQTPTGNIEFNPLSTTRLDRPSEVDSTPVPGSGTQTSTESVNFHFAKSADVSPSTAINDSRVLPALKEGNLTNVAKPNALNVTNLDDRMKMKDPTQSSAKGQKPPKSVKTQSLNATNKDAPMMTNAFIFYRSKGQTPTKSTKTGSLGTKHVDPSTTTKVPGLPSAGGQEKSFGSKLDSLNAANLAILSDSVKRDSSAQEIDRPEGTRSTQKKTRRDPDVMKPDISALEYMQEVWEAASSAPTSVMSERTKATFLGIKSGVAWQDKSLNFLEQYAKAGKASAVRLLLSQGCNPGTKEKVRRGPLYWAIKGGSQRHNKCVAALLAAGADVHVRFSGGKTVLHLAIEHEKFHGYTNLIRDLLEAGANPNLKDKSGDYPLLQILYGGYEPLEKHRRDALACLLQPHFATDVNIMPPGTLNMPLHLAVRRKDPWAVSMLLTRGALVNEPNGSGLTPLMLAANAWTNKSTHNETEVLKILLTHKANVNEQSGERQMSALHLATSCGYEQGILFLLQARTDPKIRDVKGRTPLQYARDEANIDKMGPKTHGRIMRLFFEAVGIDSIPVVEGQCAVVTAILKGMTKEAKILLDHWASPNHIYKTKEGTPLLHLALRAHNLAMVRLLVNAGAFVDAKDKSGMDAFRVCAALVGGVFAKSSFRYMQQKGRRQVVADAKDESKMDAS